MGARLDGANSRVLGKGAMFGMGLATVVMGSDANYTLVQAEYECNIIKSTSSVTLTAQRNNVLPLRAGLFALVINATTGGQSIQYIGATGTGVVVANGKTAILWCDGTNWLRVTADNP